MSCVMNHTYDTTFKLYIYKDKQNKMHFKELSNSAKKIKSARGLGGGGEEGREQREGRNSWMWKGLM